MNSPLVIPYATVDAFVERGAFSGNPAAVCLMMEFLPDAQLQAIAAEHNLSETAFVVPRKRGRIDLRWFTPTIEVDLCGHATLAAAHYLWRHSGESSEALCFSTRSGELTVRREAEDMIWMDFPAQPVAEVAMNPSWQEHFGPLTAAGRSQADYLLLESDDVEAVLNYVPDFSFLQGIEAFGIILTAANEGDDPHFVSRFFAPRAGILEDPVTGSAHCSLFPYWGGRLGVETLNARQVSSRGGAVRGRLRDSRVEIGGRCRTYAQGTIGAEALNPLRSSN